MLVDFLNTIADSLLEQSPVEATELVVCAFSDLHGAAAAGLVYLRRFHCNNVISQAVQSDLQLF